MPRGVQGRCERLVLLLKALTHSPTGAEHVNLRQEGEGYETRPAVTALDVSHLAHVREHTGCSFGIQGSSRRFSRWVGSLLTSGHSPCHEHASTFQRTPGPALSGNPRGPRKAMPPALEHWAETPAPPQGHPHRLPFPSYTPSQGSVRIH